MKEYTSLHTPDGVDLEIQVAGLASRLFAATVDHILLFCLWAVFALVWMGSGNADSTLWLAALILFVLLSSWCYPIVFELNMRGQTPGKRMTGLRVIREDGLQVGRHESILRNLYRTADALPGGYLLGIVCIMADPKGRRVGDIVAGTLVIQERVGLRQLSRAGAAWAARAEKGQAQKAVVLPGGTLTARQLSLLEDFLQRAPTLDDMRRMKLADELARPVRNLLGQRIDDAEACLQEIVALARRQETADVTPKRAQAARSGPLF